LINCIVIVVSIISLNTEFWYTINHTTSLNIYNGDREITRILDAEEQGLVVDTERRQAVSTTWLEHMASTSS